ncbi:MAG TPA: glycosyltransferase [Methylomirabilota bacterium]|jgi:D-inositol-3-phosphate glycosyltransferase|nr:glycosyltransferase [Methylomirabilota bacterium]
MSLRVAMLSVHTCPLAALGGKETGGMNVYVRELARELSRMGVAVDVFTRSQNPAIPRVVSLAERARVIHLPAGPQAPMARERIHAHLDEFVDGLEAWRAADGVEYDLLHANYWLSGVVGLVLRARWGVPLVQMFHTLGALKNGAGVPAEREPALRVAEEGRIVGAADRLVAANGIERAGLMSAYDAERARVAVIPCGVDTDLFTPGDAATARGALDVDAGPLLLYVGRIAPIKGLDTLLDAVGCLRGAGTPARLAVVGGEADEPVDGHEADVRRRAAALGLADAVTFVGALPQARLRDWYVAADVTVLPSYYESFGMVALEAMACGSPVVASRVGGLQSTVRDGLTGLLVPEGDPCALAETIGRVLGDGALAWRLGREGQRWAAQHRWPCVAEAICREYATLTDGVAEHLAAGRCI